MSGISGLGLKRISELSVDAPVAPDAKGSGELAQGGPSSATKLVEPMPEEAAVATIVGLTATLLTAEKLIAKHRTVQLRAAADQIAKRAPDLERALAAVSQDEAKHERELSALGSSLERWTHAMEELGEPAPELRGLLTPIALEAAYRTSIELHRAKDGAIDELAESLCARGMYGAASLLHRGHAYLTHDPLRMALSLRVAIEASLRAGQHENAARSLFELRGWLEDAKPEGASLAGEADRLEKLIRTGDAAARIDPSTGAELPSRTHEDFSRAGRALLTPQLRDDLEALSQRPEMRGQVREAMQRFRLSLLDGSKLSAEEAAQLARAIDVDPMVPATVDRGALERSLAELIRLTEGRTLTTSQRVAAAETGNPHAWGNWINLGDTSPETLLHDLWHEGAHHLEFSSQEIEAASIAWRAANALRGPMPLAELLNVPAEQLGESAAAKDAYFDIPFDTFYIGRVYADDRETEVLSCAMPYFLDADRMIDLYLSNPKLFDYVLGVIRTA